MLSVFEQIQERRHARDAQRRDSKKTEELFTRARKVDQKYAIQLRKIASHVGEIIKAFPAGDPAVLPQLNQVLNKYADIITPWAHHVSGRVLQEVARWDERAWQLHAREMSQEVRHLIDNTDIGVEFRQLQQEQVDLIRSIPIKAAERVHELTEKALSDSSRAASFIEEIMKSGHVARSHATLIATTEIGRATTSFTQARAGQLGSTHYRWRTARDSRVRKEHKKLEGKIFAWASPPITGSKGERSHPGAIYRCRCWPEVLFDDD